VELQRQLLQEYERREQQRKVAELQDLWPELGQPAAARALELCGGRCGATASAHHASTRTGLCRGAQSDAQHGASILMCSSCARWLGVFATVCPHRHMHVCTGRMRPPCVSQRMLLSDAEWRLRQAVHSHVRCAAAAAAAAASRLYACAAPAVCCAVAG
jgi:hypothetical protein